MQIAKVSFFPFEYQSISPREHTIDRFHNSLFMLFLLEDSSPFLLLFKCFLHQKDYADFLAQPSRLFCTETQSYISMFNFINSPRNVDHKRRQNLKSIKTNTQCLSIWRTWYPSSRPLISLCGLLILLSILPSTCPPWSRRHQRERRVPSQPHLWYPAAPICPSWTGWQAAMITGRTWLTWLPPRSPTSAGNPIPRYQCHCYFWHFHWCCWECS